MIQSDEILDSPEAVTKISNYRFPLQFKFNISSLSNDFSARDADGKLLVYVRQKLFKLKEEIIVYSDESKRNIIYKINADRIIDFNASYVFSNNYNKALGHIGRKGMRSLWKARYEIYDQNNNKEFIISEENPWSKFWDGVLGEIPILGFFTGYFFNPKYIVIGKDNTQVIKLKKEPSLWGRKFTVEQLSDIQKGEDERLLLGLMMVSLLERRRG